MPKIVFLTYHNWETKRQGGFHKLAESASQRGYETVFFSFIRPLYIFFKNEERLNRHVLKRLIKGKTYISKGNRVLNITFPTFATPGPLRRFVPVKLDLWLQTFSYKSFRGFARKHFANTDYFVFESGESLLLLHKIRKQFPQSKIIYRPSDPLVASTFYKFLHPFEKDILTSCDMSYLVNSKGFEMYKTKYGLLDGSFKSTILPNGVELNAYLKKYPVPELLKKYPTALYVGAINPDWQLVIESAIELPKIYFIIVCPEKPEHQYLKTMRETPNINYVPGIFPKEVPAWLTNANVIIMPQSQMNSEKASVWGVTAKHYQAMAAKKPIVTYNDDPELERYAIPVTTTKEDFIHELEVAISKTSVEYPIDLKERTWDNIASKFFQGIEAL